MKKKVWRSAVLCLVAIVIVFQFGITAMAAENGYTDVAPDSPWLEGIEYVTDQGISYGTSSTTFSPDALITVRQWSVMLCRAYEQTEALEKDKSDFGTYCSTQAYWNNWITMEGVTDPDQNMCRGAIYRSAFSVLDLPIYNYELYPDGYFLYDTENCVRIASELGICEAGKSGTELVTRGEAADLLYKMLTQEFTVEEPPIISNYPIVNESGVNLSRFLTELESVPQPVMEMFKDRGWKYAIDFDYISDFSQLFGSAVIGVCDSGDRCIYVSDATATLHEFGHFLDYTQGWYSRRSTLFAEESAAADAFLRDYAMTDHFEYYAEYFVYFLSNQDNPDRLAKMQELTPKTYEHFTSLAENNWGCPQKAGVTNDSE